MRMRKGQDGRQTCGRRGGAWFLAVFRFVVLQVAITPLAHSTTELPPLLDDVSPAPVPIPTTSLANNYSPSLDEGGGSLNVSVTTKIPGISSAHFNSASPGIVETNSTSANAVESTTECVDNCTTPQFTERGTTEYANTSEQQSVMSTRTEQSTVTLVGFNSTKQPDSVGQTTTPLPSQSFTTTSTPKTSTLNLTSTTPQVTDGSTSVVDTSTIVDTTFSSQPSIPSTNSPSPTLSVSPVITPSSTFSSTTQTTKPVSKSTSSSTPNKVSTSSTSTDLIATTTVVNKSGATLTTQQWVGIGIAIAAALVLLGVALIFLTWLRTRHNLSKKPIITVSRMEYAQSNTLEKKTDPQWRKSLTMALQSMNTHIEVPTETDEEMQAVDNAGFEEDSTDPKTSNQDALHLTKV